jgi:hypothetical protein
MFIHIFAKLKCNRGEVATGDPVTTGKSEADASAQASQAEKVEGLISDIDLSDVSENIRADVKKHLAEKVKLYDAGFRGKTEEFSKEKKDFESQKNSLKELTVLRDEIQGNPALEKKITKVINDFRAGNFDTDDKKTDKATKTLDRLINEASDAETKEGLRQMRQIVQEETASYGGLKDSYEQLSKDFAALKTATLSGQAERVEVKLGLLEERFGKETVGKYREEIRAAALKFPGQDIGKLFYHYAGENEIKTALLHEAKTEKELEEKRKADGSSAGFPDVKTPIEPKKDKHGRTDIKNLIGQIVQRSKTR